MIWCLFTRSQVFESANSVRYETNLDPSSYYNRGHGERDVKSDYDVHSVCHLRLYDSIISGRHGNLNSAWSNAAGPFALTDNSIVLQILADANGSLLIPYMIEYGYDKDARS